MSRPRARNQLPDQVQWGGSMRARTSILIHVFIAVQLLVPAYYYIGRRDKNDERFAWRMFSPVRMLRCKPVLRVGDDPAPVPLSSIFHEAWLTMASRGRLEVVTAMSKEVCARSPGKPVSVELTCKAVDGSSRRYGGGWDMCRLDSL